MMCAGCAANVERRLQGMDGVRSAAVNIASGTALVEYDNRRVSPADMQRELEKIGYGMIIDDEARLQQTRRQAHRSLAGRVALSWLFAIVTMALCMGLVSTGTRDADNQMMLIVALLNIVICGRQFYVNAWKQLCHGMTNMDTLITLSTGIAFIFSTFNTFFGESYWGARGITSHTYFDASVMIITFVLTGRAIEERAKNGTASAIKALMGLAPKTALVGADSGSARVFVEKPIGDIRPGDIIKVGAGEKIPVDGVVTGGLAADVPLLDESMITGEPEAVAKAEGDKVFAGTIVRQGTLVFRAEAVGSKTMLSNIIRMVQEAQGSKAPVQRIADKAAAVFVPAVLAVAVVTFALWWLLGGDGSLPVALLSAVSVLVVACPCAMGLATPTALMVGIGEASRRNILIKDATALEQLRRVDTIVLDKTGTLTIPATEGGGTAEGDAMTRRETLKPHAADAIEQLKAIGIEVYMTSGDREEAVSYWADKAGIDRWQARVMPQDKEDLVRRLQHEGHTVAMVGDGINDTQALAAADVSIAMGKGTDIAMDVAQVTLMGTDLRRITQAIALSRRTVTTIRQNLFWAFIYNIICIPLAAGLPSVIGFDWHMTPMVAAALMAFSSVSVVLNSLRLKI